MEIYCICAWGEYYPDGGLGNIKESFLDHEKALEAFDKFDKTYYDRCELLILHVDNDNGNDYHDQ